MEMPYRRGRELYPGAACARLALVSRARYRADPGTSHRHRLEENATAATIKVSADIEDALLQVFAPGAASGLRYPENHLARLGI